MLTQKIYETLVSHGLKTSIEEVDSLTRYIPDEKKKVIINQIPNHVKSKKTLSSLLSRLGNLGFLNFEPYLVQESSPILILSYNRYMKLYKNGFQISYTYNNKGVFSSPIYKIIDCYNDIGSPAGSNSLFQSLLYMNMIEVGMQSYEFRKLLPTGIKLIDEFFSATYKYKYNKTATINYEWLTNNFITELNTVDYEYLKAYRIPKSDFRDSCRIYLTEEDFSVLMEMQDGEFLRLLLFKFPEVTPTDEMLEEVFNRDIGEFRRFLKEDIYDSVSKKITLIIFALNYCNFSVDSMFIENLSDNLGLKRLNSPNVITVNSLRDFELA